MIIVITVLSVLLMAFQYFSRSDSVSPVAIIGTVVVPLQNGINKIGTAIFDSAEEKKNLKELQAEIESLQSERDSLKREKENLEDVRKENILLRELLIAKDRLPQYEMMEADIIGSDGINTFERFTINRGSIDGVRLDMNVITNDGLVGLVTYVGLNYSIVTSIIEDGINISVMTKNTQKPCILSGDFSVSGSSRLLLRNALSKVDFESDNTLVTSDISDKFLPNILVGYVEKAEISDDGLTKSGTVRTGVDFTDLRKVLVITTMKEKKEDSK